MKSIELRYFVVCIICTLSVVNGYFEAIKAISNTSDKARQPEYACVRRVRNVLVNQAQPFPSEKNAIFISTQNLTVDPCNNTEISDIQHAIKHTAVYVEANQTCLFVQMGHDLQYSGEVKMVIFLVDKYYDISFDSSYLVTIEAIQLLYSDFYRFNKYDQVGLFEATDISKIDPNVLFIILIALLSLVLGMWWGVHLFAQSLRLQNEAAFAAMDKVSNGKGQSSTEGKTEGDNNQGQAQNKKETPVPVNMTVGICGLVIGSCCVCGTILLAYFFPEAITYVIYIFYALGGLSSITICLMSILELLPIRYKRFVDRKLTKRGTNSFVTLKMNFILTFPVAVVILVAFFALRFTSGNSWFFQNLIGLALCVSFIATVRLKRFHTVVIIYVLFIIYDVFFVFITPYIDIFNKDPTIPTTTSTTTTTTMTTTPSTTSSFPGYNITTGTTFTTTTTTTTPTTTTTTSTTTTTTLFPTTTTRRPSVMEYVALGLGTSGTLPIVFTLPFLRKHPDPCGFISGYSILGLGDILVPGLLGMYCAMFDYIKDNHRTPVYSIAFCVSYVVGLAITFIALANMSTAQPALLYLIPITLISILVVAFIRKDMKDLFRGDTLKAVTEQHKPIKIPRNHSENDNDDSYY